MSTDAMIATISKLQEQLKMALSRVEALETKASLNNAKAKKPRKPVVPKPHAKAPRRTKKAREAEAAKAKEDAHVIFCNRLQFNLPEAALIRRVNPSEVPQEGPEAFCFYKGLAELSRAEAVPLTTYRTTYTSSPTDGQYDNETIRVSALVNGVATTFQVDATARAARAKFFMSNCGQFALFRQ
jgi:hypothetical protein